MKNLHLILLIIICCLFMQCKKFVEVGPPGNKQITQTVFERDQSAIAALTSIYVQMVDANQYIPYKISLYTGLAGDELTNYSTLSENNDLYGYELKPQDAVTNGLWSEAYSYIYQANSVYEGCDQSASLSAGVKKQLMAESRFIRAFWYFYLVNLYGDVPLALTTTYQVNAKLSRIPAADVYQQIILDLEYAKANLNSGYVALNSIATTTERVRPNQATASALLARVYLYTQQYGKAESESSLLLSNTGLYGMEPVGKVFLKASKEAIWQLENFSLNHPNNTNEAINYYIQNRPLPDQTNSSTISKGLLDLFDNADLRKSFWIGKATDDGGSPAVDYYYPGKYHFNQDVNPSEYSIVFRLAEQYLIRAEARAQLGNLPDASDDLDVVRKRAGLDPLKSIHPNISQAELINNITNERRRELFCEYGHRWMDMKRTKVIDQVMPELNTSKGASWVSTAQLWPIPLSEIQTNVNLKQNPGYN